MRDKTATHCFLTGDLPEESVLWMQLRKEEKESCVRLLAMESSSAAARAKVSRSASLLRQAMTLCFRSGGGDGD